MTRVLLVTDANADYENRSIAARITGATDPRIACSGHTLPPAGAMPHVMHRLMRRERQEEFDVIHAIGPASLTAVLPVGCQPIVYSPPGDQPLRGLSRLRWVSLARRVIVAAGSEAVRRELLAAGVPADCTRVVTLAPRISSPQPLSRAQLGLSDQHKVLLAVGESHRRSNHRLAAWAGVIMWFFDPNYRTLIWGRGPMGDIIRRFVADLRRPGFCIFAEDAAGHALDWPAVAALADLAIFAATKPTGLYAARVCQQLGVPVIAAPSPGALELEASNLAISDSPRARVLAQTIYHATVNGALRRQPPRPVDPDDDLSPWVRLYEDAVVGRPEQPASLTG